MLLWPASPSLDDLFTDPATGAVWRWDGVRWTHGPGGGGPSMGVTDGSDAALGHVGEYIEVTDHNISQTNYSASLIIPPGDWDVRGNLYLEQVTVADMRAMITVVLDPDVQWIELAKASTQGHLGGYVGLASGPARVSISSPTQCAIETFFAQQLPPYGAASYSKLSARRVR